MYTVDKVAPIHAPQQPSMQNSSLNFNIPSNNFLEENEELANQERRRMVERNEKIYEEHIAARKKLVESTSTRKRTERSQNIPTSGNPSSSSTSTSSSSSSSSTSSSSSSSSRSQTQNAGEPHSKRVALHRDVSRVTYSTSPFAPQQEPSLLTTTNVQTQNPQRSIPDSYSEYLSELDQETSNRRQYPRIGDTVSPSRTREGEYTNEHENESVVDEENDITEPSFARQTTMLDVTDDAFIVNYMEERLRQHGPVQKDLTWAIEMQKETYESGRDVWVPITDSFRRDLDSLRQLGEQEDPNPCFGCDYEEIEGHNTCYVENWKILLDALIKGLANCSRISSLGRELHEIFTKTVIRQMSDDGIANASSTVWTPYCLMVHFLFHNPSPDINAWVTLVRLRMLKNNIFESETQQQHILSKRVKTKFKSLKKLEAVLKLEHSWLKSNPATMAFACKDRKIDSSSVQYLSSRMPVSEQTSFSQPQLRWG